MGYFFLVDYYGAHLYVNGCGVTADRCRGCDFLGSVRPFGFKVLVSHDHLKTEGLKFHVLTSYSLS